MRAHPFAARLAAEQAGPLIEEHAQAHGWPVLTYRAEVRAHLGGLLRRCRLMIRMQSPRLDVFLRVGVLPTQHDFLPAYASARTASELLTFHERPPYAVTYGYLAERTRTAWGLELYGTFALEIAPPADLTFLCGDSGLSAPRSWEGVPFDDWRSDTPQGQAVTRWLTDEWARDPGRAERELRARGEWASLQLPSPVTAPHELSWGWEKGCPLNVPAGDVWRTPLVLEAHAHRRIRRRDVRAVEIGLPSMARRYGPQFEALGIPVRETEVML